MAPLIKSKQQVKCEHLNVFTNAIMTKANYLRMTPLISKDLNDFNIINEFSQSKLSFLINYPKYHTFYFDLNQTEDEMLANFSKSWRRSLKKAEKYNIDVVTNKDECFEELIKLYQSAKKRKQFSGLDLEIFKETNTCLPDKDKFYFVTAILNNKLLTIDVSSCFGNVALGLFQANSEDALDCYASYIVWWNVFLYAKKTGMKYYDLGGVDPITNPTVYQYKKRMGGKEIIFEGTYDYSKNLLYKTVGRTLFKIKRK